MSGALEASREAARIAQVGYTAVIDRVTPQHTHELVAANVTRSVTSAGGAPAALPALEQAWDPAHRRDCVSLFEMARLEGPFGTAGLLAFAITVEAGGERGAVAATAVLHEPSARLRADAGALSGALREALASLRPGAEPASIGGAFAGAVSGVSGIAELILLRLEGGGAEPVLAVHEGDVIAVGAVARTAEGPIVLQTAVHVTADGAERLDAVPLRLIELR